MGPGYLRENKFLYRGFIRDVNGFLGILMDFNGVLMDFNWFLIDFNWSYGILIDFNIF
jgi:hypothetical protein